MNNTTFRIVSETSEDGFQSSVSRSWSESTGWDDILDGVVDCMNLAGYNIYKEDLIEWAAATECAPEAG